MTIASSVQWMALTGERPPTAAPTASAYTAAGLPWFDYFGDDLAASAKTDKLRGMASVAEIGGMKGDSPLPQNDSVDADPGITQRRRNANQVREGPLDATATR